MERKLIQLGMATLLATGICAWNCLDKDGKEVACESYQDGCQYKWTNVSTTATPDVVAGCFNVLDDQEGLCTKTKNDTMVEYVLNCRHEKCNSMENFKRCKDVIMNKKEDHDHHDHHDHDCNDADQVVGNVIVSLGVIALAMRF